MLVKIPFKTLHKEGGKKKMSAPGQDHKKGTIYVPIFLYWRLLRYSTPVTSLQAFPIGFTPYKVK